MPGETWPPCWTTEIVCPPQSGCQTSWLPRCRCFSHPFDRRYFAASRYFCGLVTSLRYPPLASQRKGGVARSGQTERERRAAGPSLLAHRRGGQSACRRARRAATARRFPPRRAAPRSDARGSRHHRRRCPAPATPGRRTGQRRQEDPACAACRVDGVQAIDPRYCHRLRRTELNPARRCHAHQTRLICIVSASHTRVVCADLEAV